MTILLQTVKTVFFNAEIVLEMLLIAPAVLTIGLDRIKIRLATAQMEEIIQIQLGAAPAVLEL